MKKFDVYCWRDKFDCKLYAHIYNRGPVAESGSLPDRELLAKIDWFDNDEWYYWCFNHADGNYNFNDDDLVRVFRPVLPVFAPYVDDLLIRVKNYWNKYVDFRSSHGFGEPLIDFSNGSYTCEGLYTIHQPLTWSKKSDFPLDYSNIEVLWHRDNLVKIHGIADALHELGFTLVFNSKFEFSVVNNFPTWEPYYEY